MPWDSPSMPCVCVNPGTHHLFRTRSRRGHRRRRPTCWLVAAVGIEVRGSVVGGSCYGVVWGYGGMGVWRGCGISLCHSKGRVMGDRSLSIAWSNRPFKVAQKTRVRS